MLTCSQYLLLRHYWRKKNPMLVIQVAEMLLRKLLLARFNSCKLVQPLTHQLRQIAYICSFLAHIGSRLCCTSPGAYRPQLLFCPTLFVHCMWRRKHILKAFWLQCSCIDLPLSIQTALTFRHDRSRSHILIWQMFRVSVINWDISKLVQRTHLPAGCVCDWLNACSQELTKLMLSDESYHELNRC